MAVPPKLAKEIDDLPSKPEIVEEGGHVNLIFRGFDVGQNFNSPVTDLLIRIPFAYPDAGPDMFWTSTGLLLRNGNAPEAAGHLETHAGIQWRRFSWHHNGWNPNRDNLHSFLEFVRRRFREAR